MNHQEYQQAGKFIPISHRISDKVQQTQAFIYEQGDGIPIVCIHGVPASSFLYRKLIHALAEKGYRAIAFDILGMGLSSKPTHADYSWTGLGVWCTEVIKTLALTEFHLVIHDIGGPVGCEVLARMSAQVKSVTILNTLLVGLETFNKPFPMGFFPVPVIGEAFVKSSIPIVFKQLMNLRGVSDKTAFTLEDANSYTRFLKHADNGRAFLKIMRSFENTSEKENLYLTALQQPNLPKQIIWGENDKALTIEKYGYPLQKALGIENITKVKGAHFLQEDCADDIAQQINKFINQR